MFCGFNQLTSREGTVDLDRRRAKVEKSIFSTIQVVPVSTGLLG